MPYTLVTQLRGNLPVLYLHLVTLRRCNCTLVQGYFFKHRTESKKMWYSRDTFACKFASICQLHPCWGLFPSFIFHRYFFKLGNASSPNNLQLMNKKERRVSESELLRKSLPLAVAEVLLALNCAIKLFAFSTYIRVIKVDTNLNCVRVRFPNKPFNIETSLFIFRTTFRSDICI